MRAVRHMAEPNARAQPSLACARLIWERLFWPARGRANYGYNTLKIAKISGRRIDRIERACALL